MIREKHSLKIFPLILSILINLGIGGSASFFKVPQIKTWYVYLHKPVFNPPNWLFAPVWTMLYVMIAIAAYLVWQQRDKSSIYNKAKVIYFIQLSLNFSWSIVFFGLHQVFGALIIIALLFIAIILNINYFGKIDKTAGWLFIPYLLWVSFAGVLNFYIYTLNT